MDGWMTLIYHPRANPLERQNQELKKGLRTLLVGKPHRLWNVCPRNRKPKHQTVTGQNYVCPEDQEPRRLAA